ncbi:hypothetical protein E2C01_002610 [Portunus trituberculatus]|uniref:Uncharacterized protein n=1 Tax=Portunus trituberculatus TaxID=210409 RepID=A0A5B7CL77_PORTR|nr:hypothetical protein [Portunus trituberculatus]
MGSRQAWAVAAVARLQPACRAWLQWPSSASLAVAHIPCLEPPPRPDTVFGMGSSAERESELLCASCANDIGLPLRKRENPDLKALASVYVNEQYADNYPIWTSACRPAQKPKLTKAAVVQWNHVRFGVRGVSKRTGLNPVHGPSLGWASSLEATGNGTDHPVSKHEMV